MDTSSNNSSNITYIDIDDLGYNPIIGTNPRTIECNIKTSSTASTIVFLGNDLNNQAFNMRINNRFLKIIVISPS